MAVQPVSPYTAEVRPGGSTNSSTANAELILTAMPNEMGETRRRIEVAGTLLTGAGALALGAAALILRDIRFGALAVCWAVLAVVSAMGLRVRPNLSGWVPNIHAELAVHIVGSVLDQVHPHNVDKGSVTVTEEGDSMGIVLIPHRDLGGLALVLWMDPEYAQLSWASVWDLGRHDDLDLGKWIARIERGNPAWESDLRAQIITEFGRRINVTVRRNWLGRSALWCTIQVHGRPANLWIGRLPAVGGFGKAEVVPAGETSLQGPEAPTRSRPVPLDAWRRAAVAAWPEAAKRTD